MKERTYIGLRLCFGCHYATEKRTAVSH